MASRAGFAVLAASVLPASAREVKLDAGQRAAPSVWQRVNDSFCGDGGATVLHSECGNRMTVTACKAGCTFTAGCTGANVGMGRLFDEPLGCCHLLKDITVAKCDAQVPKGLPERFDLYCVGTCPGYAPPDADTPDDASPAEHGTASPTAAAGRASAGVAAAALAAVSVAVI